MNTHRLIWSIFRVLVTLALLAGLIALFYYDRQWYWMIGIIAAGIMFLAALANE